MKQHHILFVRDLLPSEGGYPAGKRIVIAANTAADLVASGAAIYVDSPTFPAPKPPFPGLPPPIPELPRKRPAKR